MYLYTSLQKKWEKILILKVDFVQYFDLDIDFVGHEINIVYTKSAYKIKSLLYMHLFLLLID